MKKEYDPDSVNYLMTGGVPDELTDAQQELLMAVSKMSKDLLKAAETMDRGEARFLVSTYYAMQGVRLRLAGQLREQKKEKEPHAVLDWFVSQFEILEKQAARALTKYAGTRPAGQWAMSQYGVGGVIAAGMLAHVHIDLENPATSAATPSKLFRFAGLDPTAKWVKGGKRPWNAELKMLLAFKLGECAVKTQNSPKAFYGRLYKERKEQELKRNTTGFYRETATLAATTVVERDGKKQTGIYGPKTEAWQWVNGCYPPATQQKLYDLPGKVPEDIAETPKKKAAWLTAERARILAEAKGAPGSGIPQLPPSQIHGRARRHVAKVFAAHFWEALWVEQFGTEPPRPWIFGPFEGAGHTGFIARPPLQEEPKKKARKKLKKHDLDEVEVEFELNQRDDGPEE